MRREHRPERRHLAAAARAGAIGALLDPGTGIWLNVRLRRSGASGAGDATPCADRAAHLGAAHARRPGIGAATGAAGPHATSVCAGASARASRVADLGRAGVRRPRAGSGS